VLLEGATLRATQAGYFGLIEHLDEQIAPLIKEFKERSQKVNRPWVILFTADHGEMLGDHGFFRKCEPYEGSANIPFIVAGPSELGFRSGLRSQTPVCLEDVMPTLLELAGAKCPRVDGVSLVSVLKGETRQVRNQLQIEHAVCYSQEQAFQALTDGHIKYIWRPLDGSEQLFNLDQDIREEHELSKVATSLSTLEQWRARMIKQLAARPEGFSNATKLIAGQPYPPLQAKDGK
jgi:arylsulfatase A-like enzyme